MTLEYPGAAVLYREASALEKALTDTDAERLLATRAELITENWDPLLVQLRNLEALAFGMGVTLWESDVWTVEAKREWLAEQWIFKAYNGTRAALDMALEINDFRLVQTVVPPQGFWASPDMSRDAFDAWIRRMPQIRIKFALRTGTSPGDVWYSDDGCEGLSAPWTDVGPSLYGRVAVIRYSDGREVDLRVTTEVVVDQNRIARDYERVQIPGLATRAFHVDDFAGEAHFVEGYDVAAQIVTMEFERWYVHETSTLYLTSLVPGLEPLRVNYEQNSDVGDGSLFAFVTDFASPSNNADPPLRAPWCHAGHDPAASMLADVLYLHDPNVAVPMLLGISFAGYDRVGIPTKYAELLVDLKEKATNAEWYEGDGFADDNFQTEQDHEKMDRSLRAVVAAKALRDTYVVSWEVTRPLRIGDLVSPSTRIYQQVPTVL